MLDTRIGTCEGEIMIHKNDDTCQYHPLLPAFMKLLAIVLFVYWGLSHLIRPEWYMVSLMGITQFEPSNGYDMWSANLIGVMNIALAITIWRSAGDPVRNRLVLDVILFVSAGTVIVFALSILTRGISPREWWNVGLIVGAVVVLGWMYPRGSK
jgi:hypothetical protein